MKEIKEFKYQQKENRFFFDETYKKFIDSLSKNGKTWTELKTEFHLRDSELKRILDIAFNQNLIVKKGNKYFPEDGLHQLLLRNGLFPMLCKTNPIYRNYNIKEKIFFSGIMENEIDETILNNSRKIKTLYKETKEYLFKKRKRDFEKLFKFELEKIKNEEAQYFLKINKSLIYKKLYGNNTFYKRGEDLLFITFLPYLFFLEEAKRKDLLENGTVKIETFNLFYSLFDKFLFPEILILPDIKIEKSSINVQKSKTVKNFKDNLLKFNNDEFNFLMNHIKELRL